MEPGPFVCCSGAEATEGLPFGTTAFGGCAVFEAVEGRWEGGLTRSCDVGTSTVNRLSFGKPSTFRHAAPSAKYIPMSAPIVTATRRPPSILSEPGRQGAGR